MIGNTLKTLKGPAIIAANHPNSMLDAIIIACECKQPVHFTIRSDMFKNPLFRFLLKYLNGIPVYRASEAKEQLKENFTSFSKCKEVLNSGGIIIIFSEGVTLHDWKLKPFKSGTAKLVSFALQDACLQNNLRVAAVGLTYSDYQYIGKTVIVQSAPVFLPGKEIKSSTEGAWKQGFNDILYQHMRPLVADMDSDDADKKRCWQLYLSTLSAANVYQTGGRSLQQAGRYIAENNEQTASFKNNNRYEYTKPDGLWSISIGVILLVLPAIAGWLLNALYYYPVTNWCRKKTEGSIFFDALAFGIYIGTYPLYVLLASLMLSLLLPISIFIWLVMIPILGSITVMLSRRMRAIRNYTHSTVADKKFFNKMITENFNA